MVSAETYGALAAEFRARRDEEEVGPAAPHSENMSFCCLSLPVGGVVWAPHIAAESLPRERPRNQTEVVTEVKKDKEMKCK